MDWGAAAANDAKGKTAESGAVGSVLSVYGSTDEDAPPYSRSTALALHFIGLESIQSLLPHPFSCLFFLSPHGIDCWSSVGRVGSGAEVFDSTFLFTLHDQTFTIMASAKVAALLEKLGTSDGDLKLRVLTRNKDIKNAEERAKDVQNFMAVLKAKPSAVRAALSAAQALQQFADVHFGGVYVSSTESVCLRRRIKERARLQRPFGVPSRRTKR
jgi:hypothetical protein